MTTKTRYRPRREVKMWLYLDKPDESNLFEFIKFLKQTRALAKTVRQGLQLIWTLQEGNTDFLFSLFPHLQEALKPPPPSAPNAGDLERVAELAAQRAAQRVMLEMPSLPATIPAAAPLKQSSVIAPALVASAAPVADAATIADDFLAFIQ